MFLAWVISLVPALIWLWLFYLQDRYEKEPKRLILGVFVLGSLIAYSVAIPIENMIQSSVSVSGFSGWTISLSFILIFGLIQETVKFLTVRLTIFHSKELNEPVDAMIYMIAAGLGFGLAYNVTYFNSLESINLGIVIARIIDFYLISAALAGISGYAVGIAKFSGRKYLARELTMFSGVLLAVIIYTAMCYAKELLQGMKFNIWIDIFVTSLLAVIVYFVLFTLIEKSVKSSPFKETSNI